MFWNQRDAFFLILAPYCSLSALGIPLKLVMVPSKPNLPITGELSLQERT